MQYFHLDPVRAQAPIPSPLCPDPIETTSRILADSFSILGETEEFLLVDKPPGLLIHPTKPGGPPTLWDGLQRLLAYEILTGNPPGILTRLDRETSGIVLVGKGRAAIAQLGRWLVQGEITKEYQALVFGWPEKERWTLDAPILRLGEVQPTQVWLRRGVHPSGAAARTEFQVLRHFITQDGEKYAIVQARPRTGRTHQIRVHLAHSGHPIVGDKLYARGEECYLHFIREGWSKSLQHTLKHPRHALHAHALEFFYRGRKHRWESPWPSDLVAWEKSRNVLRQQ